MTTISSFVERLKKIGIKVELVGNYPWIYLDKVNGYKVWERFKANHGFTVFYKAVKLGQEDQITDIPKIFKKIREMLSKEGREADKDKYAEFINDYFS